MKTGNHAGDPEHWPDQPFAAIIPIATFRSAFFYYRPHHSQIDFSGLNDLNGYTLGVIKRSIADTSFLTAAGIVVAESYKQESLFKKLKLGRIDLCGVVTLSGLQIINHLFPNEIDRFARIELPRSVSAIALMIDRDYPQAAEIASRYRNGLTAILYDGAYLNILHKYYGNKNVPTDWFMQLTYFQSRYAQ